MSKFFFIITQQFFHFHEIGPPDDEIIRILFQTRSQGSCVRVTK